jgi:hypothetical protein
LGQDGAVESDNGWTVRRRWSDPSRDGIGARFRRRFGRMRVPFRGRRRERVDAGDVAGELAHGCAPDELVIIGLVVFLAIVLFVFVWELFLFAVVAALWELLVLVLLVVAGTVARFVLRHPWIVEARHTDGRQFEWQVRGFGRSKRFVRMARERLAAGWRPDQIDESQLAEE